MAWTTPVAYSAGEVVTETKLNEQVKDNLRYLKGSDGPVGIDSSVAVSGNVTIHSSVVVGKNADISGDLTVQGTTAHRGNVTISGVLGVAGDVTISGSLSLAKAIQGALAISGDTAIHSSLTVGMNASISGSLSVAGSITSRGDTVPVIKSTSYIGSGGASLRQVTVGFTCKYVMLREHAPPHQVESFDIYKTSGALGLEANTVCALQHSLGSGAFAHNYVTVPYLDADDGFWVNDAAGNSSGQLYFLVAFG